MLKSVLQGKAYRALLWPLRRVAIVGSAYCRADHGSGASATYLLSTYPPPCLLTNLPTQCSTHLPTL